MGDVKLVGKCPVCDETAPHAHARRADGTLSDAHLVPLDVADQVANLIGMQGQALGLSAEEEAQRLARQKEFEMQSRLYQEAQLRYDYAAFRAKQSVLVAGNFFTGLMAAHLRDEGEATPKELVPRVHAMTAHFLKAFDAAVPLPDVEEYVDAGLAGPSHGLVTTPAQQTVRAAFDRHETLLNLVLQLVTVKKVMMEDEGTTMRQTVKELLPYATELLDTSARYMPPSYASIYEKLAAARGMAASLKLDAPAAG